VSAYIWVSAENVEDPEDVEDKRTMMGADRDGEETRLMDQFDGVFRDMLYRSFEEESTK
jgi:hypothetical protein